MARASEFDGSDREAIRADLEGLLEPSRLQRIAREVLMGEANVDEAIQNLWIRSLEHPPGRIDNPGGWLAQSLRNAARSSNRSRQLRRHREEAAARSEVVDTRARELLLEDVRARVAAAMEQLSPREFDTIQLRFIEGCSFEEIAGRTGRPSSTLRSEVGRALEKMRRAMTGEAGDSRALGGLLIGAFRWSADDIPAEWLAAAAARSAGGAAVGEGASATKGVVAQGSISPAALGALVLAGLLALVVCVHVLRGEGDSADDVPLGDAQELADAAPSDDVRNAEANDHTRVDAPLEDEAQTAGSAATDPAERVVAQGGGGIPVTVRVTDPTGLPLRNASLFVYRGDDIAGARRELRGVTDESGEGTVSILPEEFAAHKILTQSGAIACVMAQCDGYVRSFAGLVKGDAPDTEVRLTLKLGGVQVQGTVRDADGLPVEDALVIYGNDTYVVDTKGEDVTAVPLHCTRSGPDGRYSIRGAEVGGEQVVAFQEGRALAVEELESSEDPIVEADITFPVGATLEGAVEGPDGGPAAGARILFVSSRPSLIYQRGTESAADGAFLLQGIDAVNTRISVTGTEGGYDEIELPLSNGERKRHNFKLSRDRAVRVNVIDDLGVGVAGVLVQAAAPGGQAQWFHRGATDANGAMHTSGAPLEPIRIHVLGDLVNTTFPVASKLLPGPTGSGPPAEIRIPRDPGPLTKAMGTLSLPQSSHLDSRFSVYLTHHGLGHSAVASFDSATGRVGIERLPLGDYSVFFKTPTQGTVLLDAFEVTSAAPVDLGPLRPGELSRMSFEVDPSLSEANVEHRIYCAAPLGRGKLTTEVIAGGTGLPRKDQYVLPGYYVVWCVHHGKPLFLRRFSTVNGEPVRVSVRLGGDGQVFTTIRRPEGCAAKDITVQAYAAEGNGVPIKTSVVPLGPNVAWATALELPPGSFEIVATTDDGFSGRAVCKIADPSQGISSKITLER